MKNVVSRLSQIPRLAKLSESSKSWILTQLNEIKIEPGEYFLQQGTPANSFYVIEQGYVKWERTMGSTSGVTIFDIQGPSDSPGESSLNMKSSYPASCVALTSMSIFTLNQKAYLHLFQVDPEFAATTRYCLARRTHSLLGRIEQNAAENVEARLAGFLIDLAQRFGQKEESGDVSVPFFLTKNDYARAINCRSETIIRVMSQWRKSKLLAINENRSKILISKEFIDYFNSTSPSQHTPYRDDCEKCPFGMENS